MELKDIKPVGMLVTVCEAPFFDFAERFFYWDTIVPLKKDDVMQLETAKKLYTEEQMQEYAKGKVEELWEKTMIHDSEGRRLQLGDVLKGVQDEEV